MFRLSVRVVSVIVAGLYAHADTLDVSTKLLRLTGTQRAKLVWTRSNTNVFGFETGWRTDQVLMGFDTRTGIVDTICPRLSNYQRPLLSRNGCRVVYSDKSDTAVYVVHWSGDIPPRRVAKGVAGCLWYDSVEMREYAVYARQYEGKSKAEIRRVDIDDPSRDSLVLRFASNPLPVNGQWLGVSSDLRKVANVFGWPTVRAYPTGPNISLGAYYVNSNGCWTSMPYDTVGRVVHLNPSHTGLIIVSPCSLQQGCRKEIDIRVMNHARVASYSRTIVCVTVGMSEGGATQGGNVMVMRFDTALTALVDSVVLQRDGWAADAFPDLWAGDSVQSCGEVDVTQRCNRRSRELACDRRPIITNRAFDVRGRLLRDALRRESASAGSGIVIVEYPAKRNIPTVVW